MSESANSSEKRQGFGIPELDAMLGGGLLPGTLTVIAGATGAGKTQLGLTWAAEGLKAEGRRGVICDLASRGDSQNHAAYARRLLDWTITERAIDEWPDLDGLWDFDKPLGESLRPFGRAGRRVTRRDLEPDDWHAWKTDLARVLRAAAGFLYAHFARGARRVVVDGVEPTERMSESIQFEFFEYLYHHVIRTEYDWAARELLRERFRASADLVETHKYDHQSIGCLYLATTPGVMLEEMMTAPIGEGDVFSNANTILLMGRVKDAGRMGRALYVAKHRGSSCSDEITPYRITDAGLVFNPRA